MADLACFLGHSWTQKARKMRITRRFTTDGKSPYDGMEFRSAASEIRNPDGSVVFGQEDISVPAAWSQVACDVLAQKYFRRAGVPTRLTKVPEPDVPEFLWRHQPAPELKKLPEGERYTGETDACQVF